MANPSMFGSGFSGSLAGGTLGGIGAALTGASGGALLIPVLIGMGLNFLTSRKAANSIEDRANEWMSAALMKESKYTQSMEAMLAEKQSQYDSLFKTVYGGGMPENPSYESVFGEEKEYGFTPTERETTTGSRPQR